MELYRPVGEKEYQLIKESGFKKFPPRLPNQPLFYPVLSEQYAIEIASKWNIKDSHSGYRGYVVKFTVSDEYLKPYEIQTVGARHHQEFWIPAEALESFNANIIGLIEVVHIFEGEPPCASSAK